MRWCGTTAAGRPLLPVKRSTHVLEHRARLQKFTLPNGIDVGLLAKDTRGDAVQAGLVLRFGTPDQLMGNTHIGALTGAMLMRGTTERTRAEIRDAFDAIGTQASVSGTSSRATVQLVTTRANLPDALRLAHEVLTQPAFDAAEFEQLKRERLAALEAQRTEPQAIAPRVLARHGQPWPKGHPNYVPTIEEEIADLQAVTLAARAQLLRADVRRVVRYVHSRRRVRPGSRPADP
jgi:zinc protease